MGACALRTGVAAAVVSSLGHRGVAGSGGRRPGHQRRVGGDTVLRDAGEGPPDAAAEDVEAQAVARRDEQRREVERVERLLVPMRLEAMETEVIRSPLHQRRAERLIQRFAQRGEILEEDLLLKILRARRHEHALAAEDCRDEVRERLAGAGACFRDQHPAVFDDLGNGGRHFPLSFARLVAVDDAREDAAIRERRRDRVD